MTSRREFDSCVPGHRVVVGWDNPLMTFFGQAVRLARKPGDEDVVILWVGGAAREIGRPEGLILPLQRYLDITPEMIANLRADRLADIDRAPTRLQLMPALLVHGLGIRP